MSFIRGASIAVIAAGLALGGCATRGATGDRPVTSQQQQGGISLGSIFGGARRAAPERAEAAIGVNSFLWRASLDTVQFMPLASADPWGGVIITDWYAPPETPAERFKATVYILDTRLRADALKVSINKQVRDMAGAWVDAPVAAQTETDFENAILTRARQLRLGTIGG